MPRKAHKMPAVVVYADGADHTAVDWQTTHFFSGCKNPANVSDLITCLAAGNVIKVDRLDADLLPCVVLLANIGLRAFEQQIVDDYVILLDRMKDLFASSSWHSEFWHPELRLVASIVDGGAQGEFVLDSIPDAGYMFAVYEKLVNTEITGLFPVTKKEKHAH